MLASEHAETLRSRSRIRRLIAALAAFPVASATEQVSNSARDETPLRSKEERATDTSFVEVCSEELYLDVHGDGTETVAALEWIYLITDIANTSSPRIFCVPERGHFHLALLCGWERGRV